MSIILNLDQGLFPDLPRSQEITDKDGKINEDWGLGLENAFQALQNNFSNEGFMFPPLDTARQNVITAYYANFIGLPLPPGVRDISGANIYDTDNYVPKVFVITYNKLVSPWLIVTAAWKTYTIF